MSAHTRQEASERDDGGVLVVDRGVALETWSETKTTALGVDCMGKGGKDRLNNDCLVSDLSRCRGWTARSPSL